MKSIIRKGAALMLFMAMVINCFSVSPIYAQEDNVNSGETMTEIENSENNMEEGFPSEDVTLPEENKNNIPEKDQITHDTQIQNNDAVEDKEEVTTPVPGDTSLVNYFYVGYPYLQAPSSQEFVLSFGMGTENISKIVLKYQKDNGNLIELESSKRSKELYVFNKNFTETDQGTYKVLGFSYFIDSQEYTISFSDLEMDVRFGVNQEYDGYGENEGYTIDENGNEVEESDEINDSMAQEIESSVVSLDGSNVASTEDLVESVLKENAQTPQNNSRRKRSITTYSENNPLVICIDPGHGGSESGTVVVDGSLEKNMNLKIAMYLKEELEQYNNVKVVMTRTSDVYVSLQDRARIAANAGAKALVSIHINATGWGTQNKVSGAEVYYPHANYNASVSETGKNLAQNILNELVGLGLNNLGIKVKYVYDSETGKPANDPAYDYPDGSVGDYYGVIRYSKELGVAGIIVEHAMSDNWSDFNNFLSSDAKLKNLGIADATGIAKAFGLQKIDRNYLNQLALQYKNTIKDGTYSLSLNGDSKVVSVKDASTSDNANIIMQNNATSDYQGWRIINNDNGYVSIQNVYSGKALSINNGAENAICQKNPNLSYDSLWIIQPSGSGYKIVSASNIENYLNVSSERVVLGNDSSQVWNFKSYSQNIASILYRAHVQDTGWQSWVQNGDTAGTTGKNKRIEAINLKLSENIAGGIEYQAHVENIGWQDWVSNGQLSGTTGKNLQMEAVRIKLSGDAEKKYDVYYRAHVQEFGWLDWAKNGESAGTQGYNYHLEALEIQLVTKGGKAPGNTSVPFKQKETNIKKLSYQTHVENIGWQDLKYDGEISGTSGQSLRLEAIKISLANLTHTGSIEYATHIQDIGWQNWKANGDLSGTTGQNKRLEAIKIRLTGEIADYYDVYYRVHAQEFGWLDWAKNGQEAGTAGYSYRLEAIQIQLVEKGLSAPGSTETPFIQRLIRYQTHVENIGWQDFKYDGETSGTSGESLRLESIKITLPSLSTQGSVQYSTHIQDIGWQDWVSNGQLSGTTGQKKRLEAIKIKLTGSLSSKYDIYYRVHAQNFGWLDWAKNGDSAGTEGYAYRLEAIEIRMIPKGENAPGSTENPFYKKQEAVTSGYLIMGTSNVTDKELVSYFNRYKGSTVYDTYLGTNSKYNGVLSKGGAATIEDFCKIFYEECLAEGVKPEVAFAQSMLETGFLRYGGDVLPNQYNFAGLGATGNGVHGNSFKDVRTGIRAQVQHLKCYASMDPLNQPLVDQRWSESLRGKAPTVEKLQGTWATSTTYAKTLLQAIDRINSL